MLETIPDPAEPSLLLKKGEEDSILHTYYETNDGRCMYIYFRDSHREEDVAGQIISPSTVSTKHQNRGGIRCIIRTKMFVYFLINGVHHPVV